MNAFDKLHPAVQYHIVNSLGWPSLRPLQEKAIDPILEGHHALLLAPTAGGKTEAAVFPVFSRMLAEDWRGLSVIYLCPIKALLNNLEHRLDLYTQLLGRRVAVWHGDVGASERREILAERPDVLLTTPESLEVMLVTRKNAQHALFGNLRAVVVDEIHAFAGDDRGWHLLAVMERAAAISQHKVQRIGLSATVGNPDEILDWLTAGGDGDRTVVSVESDAQPADVQVDFVGSIDNAAIVISRLHRGEKRLVFCDSRARVEELASALRELKVETYVSHSSLSIDERRSAEQAFAEARNCVIVATSTLELGIDVGDLDRIIQIDATSTVASFLQRLGRTGRRTGSTRNCLFLATSSETLVQACGLVLLWESGYVEPVKPPAKPYHVLAQQILAVLLQAGGLSRPSVWDRLRKFCQAASITTKEFEQQLAHMLEQRYLFEEAGVISLGATTERQYGKRNYMALYSVFDAPTLFKVYHGGKELGEVDEMTFFGKKDSAIVLSLAGRAWQVVELQWNDRRAYVEPAEVRGKSRWFSGGAPMSWELAQSIKASLVGESFALARYSARARECLLAVREQFEWLDRDSAPIVSENGAPTWWTFGGSHLQSVLAAYCAGLGALTSDDLGLFFSPTEVTGEVLVGIRELLAQTSMKPNLPSDRHKKVKFSQVVPEHLLSAMLAERFSVTRAWNDLRRQQVSIINVR